VKTTSHRNSSSVKRVIKFCWILALLVISSSASAQLFVGTATNASGFTNDTFEVNVTSGVATPLFSRAVWGATYDFINNRVLFTSDGGIGGDQLYQWIPGTAAPTLVGTIVDAAGGPFRIDGLAISGGNLYGSRAAGILDGIYSIDMGTLVATLIIPTTDSISGIDANPATGEVYGVNDTAGELVKIDIGAGTITTVVAYPPAEDDIDGLAVSPGGLAYLIPDDPTPGEFFVYNLNTDAYETPLIGPWTGVDTFSGGAYMESPVNVPIPSLSRLGLLLMALMLVATAVYRTREWGFLKN